MALELPYVHVRLGDGRPRVESMTRPPPLSPSELSALLVRDKHTRPQNPPGDRVVPLPSGSWAVGRGGFGGITWRILSPSDVESIAHPAWLWRSSRWFDPAAPSRGPVPNALPLRSQLDPASRLGGNGSRTAGLLASCVAAIRKQTMPVAIVVDPNKLADPAPSGRWFLLALLTVLPRHIARPLRISTFEDAPDPDDWDIVVVRGPVDGFRELRPESHPALGGDLPASFILERLLAGDVDTVEAAAGWHEATAADPWGAAIRERRPRTGSATPFTPRRSHGPGGDSEPRRLRLNTPEAWLSLSNRSEDSRSRIITAWLERGGEPPTEGILDAVATIRPPGRDTVEWCEGLLRWAEDSPCATAATRLLMQTVDAEPLPLEPSTRGSLYTEAVRLLIKHGLFDEALAAVSGPSAAALLESGAGRVVTEAWVRLPPTRRPTASLDAIITRLLHAPEGDQAVAHLWLALMVQDQDARADHVLQRTASLAAQDLSLRIDAVLDALIDSPQAMRWVGHVARVAPPERLWDLVSPVTRGPTDALWEHCVDVRAQASGPEGRIADLVGLPQPQVARNERELRRVAASVRVWRFPDAALSEGAARLAALADRSVLWMWLQLCAADPVSTPDGVLATVVDHLCSHPPNVTDERRAAAAMAEGLGMAEGWSSAQHSELLLRLVIAPDPSSHAGGTSFGNDLALALVRGLSRRPDASEQLADVSDQICALPPDHPAVVQFLNRLLPMAFTRGVPRPYLDAVEPSRWPPTTYEAWARIMESLGPA